MRNEESIEPYSYPTCSKRRKLIIKSKKHGLTRREKIKEQLVDIESELLKRYNDERFDDENKALDRIKSDPTISSSMQ